MSYKKGDLVVFGFDEFFQLGIVKSFMRTSDKQNLIILDTVNDSPNGPLVNYAICENSDLTLVERHGYLSSGRKDCNGIEVFVGDKVILGWGWTDVLKEKKLRSRFRLHTINVIPAFQTMAGMADDGDGLYFCTGDVVNEWDDGDVKILTQSEYKQLIEAGIKEDETDFCYDKKGNPLIVDIFEHLK